MSENLCVRWFARIVLPQSGVSDDCGARQCTSKKGSIELRKNLMRRGASILAAVAVVAGGLMAGTGTGGAACIVGPNDTCTNSNRGAVWEEHAGYEVFHAGPIAAAPGDTVRFEIRIRKLGGTTGNVTKIVHHPPVGLALTGSPTASFYVDGTQSWLDLATEVDAVSGAVTMTAPPGTLENLGNVTLSYKVGGPVFIGGLNGVTFEATDVPETVRWLAIGNTRPSNVLGGVGGFGSSGS